MKFGFEREFFVTKETTTEIGEKITEFALADRLPHDDCGYLAEVRGEPAENPEKAYFLYLFEEEKVKRQAESLKLQLKLSPFEKLPKKFRITALRQFGKNPIDPVSGGEGSMYGKFWSGDIHRAGLHIHFSNQTIFKAHNTNNPTNPYDKEIAGIVDMPKFIFGLDKFFAQEIKDAKRVPGLYEMKVHGFEYRSLPANVDMKKVVRALNHLQYNRWNSDIKI